MMTTKIVEAELDRRLDVVHDLLGKGDKKMNWALVSLVLMLVGIVVSVFHPIGFLVTAAAFVWFYTLDSATTRLMRDVEKHLGFYEGVRFAEGELERESKEAATATA